MQRNLVQIARIRMEEVVPGDVVNRVPDDTRGWFIVAAVEALFDGTLQLIDAKRHLAFSASALDIVGVQLLKPIDLEVTETPGVLLDSLSGTHDATVDAAAARDAAAQAVAGGVVPPVLAPVVPPAPVPVPNALSAPAPRSEPGPEPVQQQPARPPERRTMRSLVEP